MSSVISFWSTGSPRVQLFINEHRVAHQSGPCEAGQLHGDPLVRDSLSSPRTSLQSRGICRTLSALQTSSFPSVVFVSGPQFP